ncbi:hypothetical protein JCM16303_000937 [Sporobolomyces ruberrimus]
MSSRRIPISSNQRNQPPAQSTTTPFRSSLDLVFSFSRSAGFFGENLPSGPSFVDEQRYRPPNYDGNLDDEGEDDSLRAGSHERETTGGTTSEYEESYVQDDEEPDAEEEETRWAPDEDVQSQAADSRGNQPESTSQSSAAATGAGQEQLPRNAKRFNNPYAQHQAQQVVPRSILSSPTPSFSSNSVASSPPSQFLSRLPPPQASAKSPPSAPPHAKFDSDERTTLLPTAKPSRPSPDALSKPRRPSNDRKPSYGSLTAAALERRGEEDGTGGMFQRRQRRASTFSKEAWKAAIEEHRGESTWFQSLFNTVNVLVGVGLLAEPLAFAYGGWFLGTLLLLFCALVTNYTAKMLAALMRLDPTQHTYADVLIKAFGPRSRQWIYALFVIELGTFSVAAIELFADSLNSLFPRVSSNLFKLASYFILVPTTFLPLRLLSLTSLLGILSSIVLLSVIIADGTIKTQAPGSLWSPMPTSFGPNWKKLPICFGLMMSGFSGHAVVPSLYRDMKNPQHFSSMINVAYVIAFSVSMIFAILGYVMFGNSVSAEITKDLSRTAGYPVALTKVAVWMVAINPLVKYAVANKPLVTTFEHLIGLHPIPPPSVPPTRPALTSAISTSSSESGIIQHQEGRGRSASSRPSIRPSLSQSNISVTPSLPPPSSKQRRIQLIRYYVLRPVLSVVFVLVAVAIPDFDRVLSFLGSASAFVICCVGPIGAYLILSTTISPDSKVIEREGGGGEEWWKRGRKSWGTSKASREENGYHKAPSNDPGSSPAGGSIASASGSGNTSNDTITQVVERREAGSSALLVAEIERELPNPTRAQQHWLEGATVEALVIGKWERALCWVLLVVSILMALVGTIWSFLPEF